MTAPLDGETPERPSSLPLLPTAAPEQPTEPAGAATVRPQASTPCAPAALPQKLALSVAEVVKLSGVGRTTVYLDIKDGRLRSSKVRWRRVILYDDPPHDSELPSRRSQDHEPRTLPATMGLKRLRLDESD